MLFHPNISIDEIQLGTTMGCRLLVARMDKLHPVISGNKLFKLHYFLKEGQEKGLHRMKTFGGPYSNHLVAAAFAARQLGWECTGIVRGEAPRKLSQTLHDCLSYGMKLEFVDRSAYNKLQEQPQADEVFIPEGGYHPLGAKGAALIMDHLRHVGATHICTAVGTATTIAGLQANATTEKIIAIPVIKGMMDLADRVHFLTGNTELPETWGDYHCGGYAKKTPDLLAFMNELYVTHGIPTDFIYTAKMMYAVMDKIKNGHFPLGSIVLCLHTGGLQGNRSLAPGTLVF